MRNPRQQQHYCVMTQTWQQKWSVNIGNRLFNTHIGLLKITLCLIVSTQAPINHVADEVTNMIDLRNTPSTKTDRIEVK